MVTCLPVSAITLNTNNTVIDVVRPNICFVLVEVGQLSFVLAKENQLFVQAEINQLFFKHETNLCSVFFSKVRRSNMNPFYASRIVRILYSYMYCNYTFCCQYSINTPYSTYKADYSHLPRTGFHIWD